MRFSFLYTLLFVLILFCGLSGSAHADQGELSDINTYTPPPMFGEPVEKSALIKNSDYSRIISGTADILPPINKTAATKQIEHIFPPIPPRRPEKFSVSAEFLNSMRNGNVHKEVPAVTNIIPEHSLEIMPLSVDEIYRTLSDNGLE